MSTESREIRALSACLTGVVLVLAAKLDVSREEGVDQLRLKLLAMLLASAWAGPLTVVAGYYAYPGRWRVLQPCVVETRGGKRAFVAQLHWRRGLCCPAGRRMDALRAFDVFDARKRDDALFG